MNQSVSSQETLDNFSFSVTPTSKHLLMTFSPISYLTSLHCRHMQPNSAWNGKLSRKISSEVYQEPKCSHQWQRERKIHIFWRKCVVFNSVAMQLLGSSGWFIGCCYAPSAFEIIVLSSMWFFHPVFFSSTKWNELACSLRMSKSNDDDWLSKHHL